MGEVSYLKLKLADMEGKQNHGAERQHKAEVGLSPSFNRHSVQMVNLLVENLLNKVAVFKIKSHGFTCSIISLSV